MAVCPRCLMTFPQHVVVKARCTKRWRGHNFDAAAAEGALGAAVAHELGMSVRTTADLTAFFTRAFVKAYGEGLDPNPGAAFDVIEGESYEFHVGLRQAVPDDVLVRIEHSARDAIARARDFVLV